MLSELMIRTLCDTLPTTPADAVFMFGQTADNQQAVFDASVYLVRNNLAKKVMFIHSGAMSGYPGFEAWLQELQKMGVQQDEVEPVPVAADLTQLNTRIEAEAAIKLAREKEFRSLITTASPFQQTRAFMAAVTAALSFFPEIKLYSYPGKALPWCEEVKHSQGKVQGTRAELIAGEMERIKKYNEKGDLATAEKVLAYLNRRDSEFKK